MKSPAYYRTRSIVRWTFWGTAIPLVMFLTIQAMEWFTWVVWYGIPEP